MEMSALVQIEVHETIGIPIQAASTLASVQFSSERRRQSLLSLDKVCTAIMVEDSGGSNVRVFEDKRQTCSDMPR